MFVGFLRELGCLCSSDAVVGGLASSRAESVGFCGSDRRWRRVWWPERPARGGSVASGPRTERMQPGAGCGDHLAARGGLARDIGLDCDFAPFLQNRDVQRSAYVDKVVVVADVMGPL